MTRSEYWDDLKRLKEERNDVAAEMLKRRYAEEIAEEAEKRYGISKGDMVIVRERSLKNPVVCVYNGAAVSNGRPHLSLMKVDEDFRITDFDYEFNEIYITSIEPLSSTQS